MKGKVGITATVLAVFAIALLATIPAWAQGQGSTVEDDQAPAAEESAAAPESEATDADASADATTEADTDPDVDKPKVPPPTEKELYDGLIAISPAGGVQLPTPPVSDQSDWQTVTVGFVSMRVPADWTVQNQIGKPGDEDQTIGLSPPSNDLYVELRHIQNADSNYMNTPLALAVSDYRSAPDRLKDGITFGYQPMVIDGAVGYVETMNQFGKEKNDDGTPTFRMINWRGRWEQNDAIQRVEFGATFAQDGYEKFAPVVSEILATVKIQDDQAR
jgi:hypothetical protein